MGGSSTLETSASLVERGNHMEESRKSAGIVRDVLEPIRVCLHLQTELKSFYTGTQIHRHTHTYTQAHTPVNRYYLTLII